MRAVDFITEFIPSAEFMPSEAAAAVMQEGTGLWDGDRTYPIVVDVMKGDTLLILFSSNKNEYLGLAAAYEGPLSTSVKILALYTAASNASPSVRLQEFDDKRSIPLRCHRMKSHAHGAVHMTQIFC